MAGGNAIRGSRVGAGPMGESERGEQAPRTWVSFWCANGHESKPAFVEDAVIPDQWDCPRCGLPAGKNQTAPPQPPKVAEYKSHYEYVKERRTEEQGNQILEDALRALRERRGEVTAE